MKVLVVGYGSMGRRRIRLTKQIYPDAQFICVDSNPERTLQIKDDGFIAYSELSEAIKENPDFAFVSTSPLSHASIIPVLLSNGINAFSEFTNKIIKMQDSENTVFTPKFEHKKKYRNLCNKR